MQRFWRIGATSLVNVGAFLAAILENAGGFFFATGSPPMVTGTISQASQAPTTSHTRPDDHEAAPPSLSSSVLATESPPRDHRLAMRLHVRMICRTSLRTRLKKGKHLKIRGKRAEA